MYSLLPRLVHFKQHSMSAPLVCCTHLPFIPFLKVDILNHNTFLNAFDIIIWSCTKRKNKKDRNAACRTTMIVFSIFRFVLSPMRATVSHAWLSPQVVVHLQNNNNVNSTKQINKQTLEMPGVKTQLMSQEYTPQRGSSPNCIFIGFFFTGVWWIFIFLYTDFMIHAFETNFNEM